MMVSQRMRKTREVTGPTPHSVGILARAPNTRPPEYLILERRKQEEKLEENQKMTNYMELCDLKNEWERWTDKKIQLNTVKRRLNGMLQANESSIEDRRERLRDLLQTEQIEQLKEMDDKQETTIERQAKMRSRAKYLKEQRETERLKLVQKKYDQKFREECEELRSTVSKRAQDQICAERLEQMQMKEQFEDEKRIEDAMYADLWNKDMLEKAEKEERKARERHERNQAVVDILQKQMAALQLQKDEAKRLKEEEAQLLKEQDALRKLEERRAYEDKIQRQRETRDMLDLSLKIKMKRRAKDEQEQLAFDLKMLEQLLEESRNEAMEQMQRKKELREEDQRYRTYLQQLMEEERRKEKELDALCNEEVEKTWQKRLEGWRQERLARKRLLNDVLAGRAEQIRDRLIENERQQLDAQRERDELIQTIERNKQLDKEELQRIRQKNLQYQSDLEGQIDYNCRLKEQDRQYNDTEYKLGLQAEYEYEQKIRDALNNPVIDKLHPMRRRVQSASLQVTGTGY
ncbi:cilia- and flagella-associated protein 53 [Patella vulgata]|uniref:cilia- and flagella-associated protein 53 n=1 Tax=Patella vulgata TaxID=6465 RepID=UPI00217F56CF|nr:cilia- and flagella-associated protein 53 [Patella vulgata]